MNKLIFFPGRKETSKKETKTYCQGHDSLNRKFIINTVAVGNGMRCYDKIFIKPLASRNIIHYNSRRDSYGSRIRMS